MKQAERTRFPAGEIFFTEPVTPARKPCIPSRSNFWRHTPLEKPPKLQTHIIRIP